MWFSRSVIASGWRSIPLRWSAWCEDDLRTGIGHGRDARGRQSGIGGHIREALGLPLPLRLRVVAWSVQAPVRRPRTLVFPRFVEHFEPERVELHVQEILAGAPLLGRRVVQLL